jgi:nicotinamidase-related amidase
MDGGAEPFATTSWPLVPGATAVVVIDAQNDFLHEDGWYAKSGIDIEHMRRAIGPIAELVTEARAKRAPIVWTRHGFKGEADAGVFFQLRPFLADGGLRQGTWGYELYAELPVEAEDWFVDKSRLSAFYNTNLELILRGLGAETVLFGGVLTNQCIAATSNDANFRDFRPIVVEECAGTTLPHLHEPALEMIRVGWGEVRSLADTLAELRALAVAAT